VQVQLTCRVRLVTQYIRVCAKLVVQLRFRSTLSCLAGWLAGLVVAGPVVMEKSPLGSGCPGSFLAPGARMNADTSTGTVDHWPPPMLLWFPWMDGSDTEMNHEGQERIFCIHIPATYQG
jgi:hypothetical protein